MKDSIIKIIKRISILFFWLIIWELGSLFLNKEILLPGPISVFKRLSGLLFEEYFWKSIFYSLLRVFGALIISIIMGIIFGIMAGIFKIFEEIMEPFMAAVKSTPVMSIIILALVWLKAGNVAIFTAMLICFPIIYTNVLQGLKSVDTKIIEMARLYRVKKVYVIKYVYLPAIKSYIVSGIILCLGLAWKVVVASEILSTPKYSIGLNLLNSKTMLDTEELFAWTIVVVILSLILENVFRKQILKKGDKYNNGNGSKTKFNRI
ncbi:ABC transporter permease subunit [Clostridium sp. KNHs214]|uniref:ABC transporter permease n=1 Tax=Clostridium sp. KNHs214 TaxID=1540257 RepID=UPI00068EF7DE|nr:ABC transporter permease subunit [Clostridium sp. KNHs214]